MHNPQIIFLQLFDTACSGYTYILADAKTKDGIIIDPVFEKVERDLKLIQEMGITLRYILDTHVHADHITGSGMIAKHTGAQIAMNASTGAAMDIPLHDGQVLICGAMEIKAISTPGHTNGCMCYYIGNAVFTGDTLLIRGNGRTDFQEGSPEIMYQSITQKLYQLPDDTIVYPSHDYAGITSSTIGLEKKFNKRITINTPQDEFVHIMNHLNLPLPKNIAVAVPANLNCGRDTEQIE